MKVYFAPCGIGLGHVGRSVPIARRLLEKEKAEIVFSTYREGIGYVEQEGFRLIKAPSIGFQVRLDGTIDFRQTAVNPGPFLASFTVLKQITSELESIESFGPDVVVSDSRLSPLLAAKALGVPRLCMLNQFQVIIPRKTRYLRLARFADSATLTIVGKMWTSANTVLIPDFPQPYTISTGNLRIPKAYRKNVELIGPMLPERPNELPGKRELRQKLGLPLDKPVVFVPISGPTTEKAFLTGILRKILLAFPEEYEVVMSYGYPSRDERPVRHGNVTIYKWVKNRFEYLKACDVVVSRAGHGTISQCMSYGKPMILIPTPGHTEQLSNAKQAEGFGTAKIILQKCLTRERLLDNMKWALRADTAEKTEQVGREIAKYDGLESAVKVVVELANG